MNFNHLILPKKISNALQKHRDQQKKIVLTYNLFPTEKINLKTILEARLIKSIAKKFDGEFILKIVDIDINPITVEYCKTIFTELGFDNIIYLSSEIKSYIEIANRMCRNINAYIMIQNKTECIFSWENAKDGKLIGGIRANGLRQYPDKYNDPLMFVFDKNGFHPDINYICYAFDIIHNVSHVFLNREEYDERNFTHKYFCNRLKSLIPEFYFHHVVESDIYYDDVLSLKIKTDSLEKYLSSIDLFSVSYDISLSKENLLWYHVKNIERDIPRIIGIYKDDVWRTQIWTNKFLDNYEEINEKFFVNLYEKNKNLGKKELFFSPEILINKNKIGKYLNLLHIGVFEYDKINNELRYAGEEEKKGKISWLSDNDENKIMILATDDLVNYKEMYVEKCVLGFSDKSIVQIYDYGFYLFDSGKLIQIKI